MHFQNEICRIDIEVAMYTLESADNKHYDLVYNPGNYRRGDYYNTLAIHVDTFFSEYSIALVGSYVTFGADCVILDESFLTILQDYTITQINVIDGSLVLYRKLRDFSGVSYGIYKVQDGYIVYGELEIVMLDLEFNEKWNFLARDIITSFEIAETTIKLSDWNNNHYEIDFNGKSAS